MAMKESFWKVVSLALLTCLIVVVASWATGMPQPQSKSKTKKKDDEQEKRVYTGDDLKGVIIEKSRERYRVSVGGGSRGTDNEKIILYDTWDVANTKDIWFMDDPHTTSPRWVKIPFKK
jgi:hypothetical protein